MNKEYQDQIANKSKTMEREKQIMVERRHFTGRERSYGKLLGSDFHYEVIYSIF